MITEGGNVLRVLEREFGSMAELESDMKKHPEKLRKRCRIHTH